MQFRWRMKSKIWLKIISMIIIQAFLLSNAQVSFAAFHEGEKSAADSAYLAPDISLAVPEFATTIIALSRKAAQSGLMPYAPIEVYTPEIKFGTSGWRWEESDYIDKSGRFRDDWFFNDLDAAILAIAERIKAEGKQNQGLVIGYDTRQTGAYINPVLGRRIAEVLASQGIKVYYNESYTPVPVVSQMIRHYKAAGGITLTASHNPGKGYIGPRGAVTNYNGIKFNPEDGGPADKDITDTLGKRANELRKVVVITDYNKTKHQGNIDSISLKQAIKTYLEAVEEMIDFDSIKAMFDDGVLDYIVFDAKNGSAIEYYRALAKRIGLSENQYEIMNDTHDPSFGGKRPEPAAEHSKELINRINELEAQGKKAVAISADPDADRNGVVDASGEFIDPNMTLALEAQYALQQSFREWLEEKARKESYFIGVLARQQVADILFRFDDFITKKEVRNSQEYRELVRQFVKDTNASIGKTVATSNMINAITDMWETKPYEEPVGFKWFRPYLLPGSKTPALVVGEESQGLNWKGKNKYDVLEKDAFMAGFKMLELMSKTDSTPLELAKQLQETIGFFAYNRGNVNLLSIVPKEQVDDYKAKLKENFEAFKKEVEEALKIQKEHQEKGTLKQEEKITLGGKVIKDAIFYDGYKVIFEDDSWFLIRFSGTEPVVRLYTEAVAPTMEEAENIRQLNHEIGAELLKIDNENPNEKSEAIGDSVALNPNYRLLDTIPELTKELKSTGEWENVLFRCVVNVKSNKEGMTDDPTRLDNMAETLRYLLNNKFTPILIGHNGSTKFDKEAEKWKDNREELDHVYNYLKRLVPLGTIVYHRGYRTGKFDESGREIIDITKDENGSPIQIVPGKINLLNNVRLDKEQGKLTEKEEFAQRLMALTGPRHIYVADDFADVNSKGASVEQLPFYANEVYVGQAMLREFNNVRLVLKEGIKGLVFGTGEKLDDKLPLLKGLLRLLHKDGYALMGSAPTKALRNNPELLKELKEIAGDRLVLADDFSDETGFDIGPKTIAKYKAILDKFGKGDIILANGTMGFMEHKVDGKLSDKYTVGSKAVFGKLKDIAKRRGVKNVVVGGDGGSTAKRYELDKEETTVTFTGGNVPLNIIINELLRGIKALAVAQNVISVKQQFPDAPEIIVKNIVEGVIYQQEHLNIIKTLLLLNQAHLFEGWDEPGINDEKKVDFLDEMIELNENYPDGLLAYQENSRRLLEESKRGDNPFEGYIPTVPEGVQIEGVDDDFIEKQFDGLKNVNKAAFVMVAGGVGDRLGYKGIKIDIPISLATMDTYLDYYISNITQMQRKSNELNKTDNRIPFVIMTSNDTHEMTVDVLKEKGYPISEKQGPHLKYWELEKGDSTIYIIKQGMVPALINNNADFTLEADNSYKLATKPHGHGDVHMLLYQSGLVKEWVDAGITHTIFFQDTNAQVMNAVLPSLSVSHSKDFDFNFTTVCRAAGEAAGMIMDLNKEKARAKKGNVEYNQADPVLKDVVRGKIAKDIVQKFAAEDKKTPEVEFQIKNMLKGLNDTMAKFQKEVLKEGEEFTGEYTDYINEFIEKLITVLGATCKDHELSYVLLESAKEHSKLPESFLNKAMNLSEKFSLEAKNNNFIYSDYVMFNATVDTAAILFNSGDIPDETGNSPFPGNLNVFTVKNISYNNTLNKMHGIIGEFINPKYTDETKTAFTKPTRPETMMQDLAFEMEKVGVTNFHDKRSVFSPVKNDLKSGAQKPKSGNYPDAMPTGEADFHKTFRQFLELAGVKITVEAKEIVTKQGVPCIGGAKVVLKPNFATIAEEVRRQITGGAISDASALVINGEKVLWDNVLLDGALVINAVNGSSIKLSNVNIKNAGWNYINLSDSQMHDADVSAGLKVRGYDLEKKETFEINLTAKGQLLLRNMVVKDNVVINSEYDGPMDLIEELRGKLGYRTAEELVLENIVINIDKNGNITTTRKIPKAKKPLAIGEKAGIISMVNGEILEINVKRLNQLKKALTQIKAWDKPSTSLNAAWDVFNRATASLDEDLKELVRELVIIKPSMEDIELAYIIIDDDLFEALEELSEIVMNILNFDIHGKGDLSGKKQAAEMIAQAI